MSKNAYIVSADPDTGERRLAKIENNVTVDEAKAIVNNMNANPSNDWIRPGARAQVFLASSFEEAVLHQANRLAEPDKDGATFVDVVDIPEDELAAAQIDTTKYRDFTI